MRPVVLLAIALMLPAAAQAQVPAKLGYQGRLLRSDGTPESGVMRLKFSLLETETGGTPLWSEEQILPLSDGYYATHLGLVEPLGDVLSGGERFLEIAVEGVPLLPRHRVGSVPYALAAGKLVGGTVDASSISINGTPIVDSSGKVEYQRLRPCGNAGELLKWDGSTWVCQSDAAGLDKVVASAPLSGEGTSGAPLTLPAASATSDGYLTKADWAAFAAKLAVSAPLSGEGTSGSPLSLPAASASADGYLTKADWAAFSAKVAGDDARLTDARDPKPGSASYIQSQSASAQNASFNISGNAAVGGKVNLGGSGASAKLALQNNLPATDAMVIGAALNGTGRGLVVDTTTRTVAENTVQALQVIDRAGGTALAVTVGGNVGIGTATPAVKLDVAGQARIQGVVVNESTQTDGPTLFAPQAYFEAGTFPFALHAGAAPSFVALKDLGAPFGKVALSNGLTEFSGDFVPVQPGESLVGEIWAMRASGSTGTAGGFYFGVARYDKDKKPITGNSGLDYFVIGGANVPQTGVWTRYTGATTLPTSHTPYEGSDGGPVRYVRPYVIVNYNVGTIPTYWGGAVIRRLAPHRDSGATRLNGRLGVGVSPAAMLHVVGDTRLEGEVRHAGPGAGFTRSFITTVAPTVSGTWYDTGLSLSLYEGFSGTVNALFEDDNADGNNRTLLAHVSGWGQGGENITYLSRPQGTAIELQFAGGKLQVRQTTGAPGSRLSVRVEVLRH